MAKNSLINGSIWEQYSQKVQDRMNNPRYMGEITEEEAKARGGKLVVADFGAESCGDAVRLYWLIDPKTDRILDAKFKSFGWDVQLIDGHDFDSIAEAVAEAKSVSGRPHVIIAKTVKGKGVSFMEDNAGWHGKAPGDEELATAIEELGGDN